MSSQDEIQRSILPIPDKEYVGFTTYDAKDPDTKYPPIRDLRPPQGAPNVLLVLIDDAGFGSSSAFGGPCYTPNAEQLAAPHPTAKFGSVLKTLLHLVAHFAVHRGQISYIVRLVNS